jgi:hypothetical protein
MVAYDYGLLPQAEEDAIHNVSRLLSVEIRPYQRLTSRLLKADSLLHSRPAQLLTPPPDASAADEEAAANAALEQAQQQERQLWYDNVLLDAGLLDSSVLRMEMLHKSNGTERERYAKEKVRIIDTAQAIRDNTVELRAQLEQAKQTLEQRKKFDERTEKITASKVLKPREEQAIAHAKLDEEIRELRDEVEGFKKTWMERRVQFGRIVEEGRLMLRMIKDEKEEAERKDMMKNGDDIEDGEASTTKGEMSRVGTPRPDAGGLTPLHVHEGEGGTSLKVPQDRLAPLSRSPSVARSTKTSGEDCQDTEMADTENAHDEEEWSGFESGEEREDGMDES